MKLALPDFRIEMYLGRYEFSARHYLCGSDAQTLTIGELLAMASDEERAAFNELPLGYTPTWGTDRLLGAISDHYDKVDRDHILVFAGAEEALFWAGLELVGPGDHAVVTVPNYQSTEAVPLSTGAEVSGLMLEPASDWALDLRELERMLKPNTRLIAVNFPNNPTGVLPDPATFSALVDLCEDRGIRLLSDEVYRGTERDPAQTLPHAADLSPTAISLNVMSKAYGLPGLRIGWLACRDRALLERLERRKQYTSICNSAPSELLASIALRTSDRLLARTRAIIASNVALFGAFFESWPELFDWAPPQAGAVAFPRYLGSEGIDELARDLVEQAGVLLLPASVMRSDVAHVPADRFRIGLARLGVEEGLAAFDKYLRAHR
ncbi:MAG TPA: aminotransferase class I/II-fold pyridoxal phosphate-dependent enzyme [Jiangellaceae bacterium]|nr:aminotransferase class I/II-fold pyridoxal phosphate-dependent enzyme [Jiangellaceae bacterium]